MLARLSPLLLGLLLAAPVHAQDVEVLVETWSDGSKKVEREVVRSEDGEPIDDGAYRSWHENGQLFEEGRCSEGKRVDTWRTYWPNGQLASKGALRRGLRIQKWVYFDENGARDGGESGEYSAEFETWEDGTPRSEAEYRYKHRHGIWRAFHEDGSLREEGTYHLDKKDGRWTTYWPEGGVMTDGAYDRAERVGPWTFTHPNGYVDPELLAGRYEEGERVGPLEDLGPASALAPDSPFLDTSALTPPPSFARATEGDRAELAGAFAAFLAGGEGEAEALETLAGWREASVPMVLTRLLALDPTRSEDALLGYRLHYVLLSRALEGHVFPWRSGTSPEDVASNRRAILRWHTLWRLEGRNARFWEELVRVSVATEPERLYTLPGTVEPGEATSPLGPPAATGPGVVGGAPPGGAELAAIHAKLLKLHGGRGTEDALAEALAWLASAQSDDGRWDSDGWPSNLPGADEGGCTGVGLAYHDVGLTGLALLAFLQAGYAPSATADVGESAEGGHSDVVRRGIAWLGTQQDPRSGILGPRGGHDYAYSHAIATAALVEAEAVRPDPILRERVQLAVNAILAAQNEGLGWRYEMPAVQPPSVGESDTSVTVWMVAALAAAERNGYRVGQHAFDGALNWLDRMTEEMTGRVGYTSKGELSARTAANQDYPRVGDESMTAAALYARILCGQDPEKASVMGLHSDVLLAALPRRTEEDKGNPMYYWFHGTHALFQLGGPSWRTWNEAMKEAVLAGQRDDGPCAGSWDPVGPWGYVGGRVYATSMMALCLGVYFRPRVLE